MTFDASVEKTFWKHNGIKRKLAFSPLPHNVFNFNKAKILSSIKGLSENLYENKVTKTLQQTTEKRSVICINPHNRRPWETNLLKTLWKKGEIVRSSLSFFPQCFLPIWITFCHFRQLWNCRLQTLPVQKSIKFFFWERINQGTKGPKTSIFFFCHYVSTEEKKMFVR